MTFDAWRRGARAVLAAAAVLILASCSTKPEEPAEVYTQRKQADGLMVQGHQRTDRLALDAARSAYDAALGLYASLDDRDGTASALLALGRIARMSGSPDDAAELYGHAESLARRGGGAELVQDARNHLADLALRRGDPVAAADLLADSEPPIADGRVRAAQLRLRGSARYELGAADEAEILLIRAGEIAESAGEAVEAAQSWYKLASMASLEARFDAARTWALRALEADKSAEYSPGIAADLRALAIISAKAGDDAAAEDFYRRAWLAWRGLGRSDDAASARRELESLTGRPVSVP